RSEPGVIPSIIGFTKDSVAHESDRLAPGDRICSVNGISTARLTNDEVLRLLDNVEERATLELAEVPVEKINGSLGVTIRGGQPENCIASADLVLNSRSLDALPLVITHVRPGGAAYNTSRIKPGDRLLKVDHILQNCPQVTSLTIEYDVSIMESVKLATGPLLIEIERPCNEDLGLFLSNQRFTDDVCGALHPGDQLLAFDDHVIDGNNYTAEEVMCYLENCEPGFTRLHVAPRHILSHGGRFPRENSISGTLNSKKYRQRFRQNNQQNYMSMGVCRTESLNIQLEVPPGHSSGLLVHEDNSSLVISHIAPQSPSYRSGCLQVRDRVMSINGHENLSLDVANEILQRRNDSQHPKYLTLNVEFSMPNTIEASSGVFNVKLAKTTAGLGITITDIITLKIRKRDLTEDWSNIHKNNAKLTLQSFSSIETKAVVHSGEDSGHHTDSPNNSTKESERSHGSDNTAVFMIEIIRQENGPLGLTIAGSEDVNQPILLSGLVQGGLAEKSGKLAIGDELLSINGESVLNKPLSEAIKLLQQSGQRVQIQVNGTRTVDYDCCLTVPLIASAGERLEIVVQRLATSRDLKNHRVEDTSSPSDISIVTKTI
ncbi:unnamed protein product, partial [Leptidea sinapis]